MAIQIISKQTRLVRAFGVALALGLCLPVAACELDGVGGPSHGGFGGWGRMVAMKHATQSSPFAGNSDVGDNDVGRDANAAVDAEPSSQTFDTSGSQGVEIRERGGSVLVEEVREQDPDALQRIR